MIEAYWKYIFHPVPTHFTYTGLQVIPDLLTKLLQWTSIFTTIFLIAKFLIPYLFPQYYSKLTARKQREFPSYVISTIHLFYVIPMGWKLIIEDFQRTDLDLRTIHYAQIFAPVVPFVFSYFTTDLLFYAIPEFFLTGNMEYILHHVVTAVLLVSVMSGSGHMLRYSPHLLIAETPNLFFNLAWFMRTSDFTKSWTIVGYLEILFLIFFFTNRVVNLPLALYAAFHARVSKTMGVGRYALIPIAFLQWFWFYKIMSSLSQRNKKKAEEARKQD